MPSVARKVQPSKLSARQRQLVKRIKGAGLKPVMYRRKGNAKGFSVHNPFLDVQRTANVKPDKYVMSYPQASDTARQHRVNKSTRKMLGKKNKILPALKGLFKP